VTLKGNAHVFGNSINTDYIISGRYKFNIQDPKELALHLMEDLRPDFYKSINQGDFIVAGENFGCGSSREQAPIAIKYAGISAVIANSFARIFFRNAINIGLLLIEADTVLISEKNILDIDTDKGIILNRTTGKTIKTRPLPDFMAQIIRDGGVIEHFKKYGGFKIGP
jgi:3-isopropylmalate/(R)-2-methylmalate dehydratase small subunit